MKNKCPVVFALLMLSSVMLSCKAAAPESKDASTTPAEAKAPEASPVKVLVRRTETEKCAADGYLWLAMLIATGNKAYHDNPESMKNFKLLSEDGMIVTEEDLDAEKPSKTKKEVSPAQNPKDFDFVVTHRTEHIEKTKYSLNAALQIAVKENWNVEKVSDPSVTKMWTFSYVLNGGSNLDAYEKTASDQLEKVVLATRAPYVREIAAFIQANRGK